ncbi:hypothetical protein [Rhodobacter sp. NSM]|uniref:hypothetical protein n=1 Tax=Rhodobacter sp. NSM TaxID=3457501 RepID=UPI003FD2C343
MTRSPARDGLVLADALDLLRHAREMIHDDPASVPSALEAASRTLRDAAAGMESTEIRSKLTEAIETLHRVASGAPDWASVSAIYGPLCNLALLLCAGKAGRAA